MRPRNLVPPAARFPMETPDYTKLLALLDAAKLVFARNTGEFSPADLRIRCLFNIAEKETRRALLESSERTAEASDRGREQEAELELGRCDAERQVSEIK